MFFKLGGSIVFCYDINGLFTGLKQEHNPPDWRLFIDHSQSRLKAVLKINGIPNVSFVLLTPYIYTCDYMKTLLEAFQNNVEQRIICGGLNFTVFLIDVQEVFTKFCCFLLLCGCH